MTDELTHFNSRGEAHMVDVSAKEITRRQACARGVIRMLPSTLAMIERGDHHKGDVLGIARIAAIMAAKKTADLIPLCHPLSLSAVAAEFTVLKDESAVECRVTVTTDGKTGVEMEALTAVQIGLLTVYDMCKAVDRGMTMGDIQLMEKHGGKSGSWQRTA